MLKFYIVYLVLVLFECVISIDEVGRYTAVRGYVCLHIHLVTGLGEQVQPLLAY